jgi:antitoxin CptB
MDDRRKRARFRAWRRGLREIDLILGGFADSEIERLDPEALCAFEALLDLPDQDVYDWIIGRAPAPASVAGLIHRIQETFVPATRPE